MLVFFFSSFVLTFAKFLPSPFYPPKNFCGGRGHFAPSLTTPLHPVYCKSPMFPKQLSLCLNFPMPPWLFDVDLAFEIKMTMWPSCTPSRLMSTSAQPTQGISIHPIPSVSLPLDELAYQSIGHSLRQDGHLTPCIQNKWNILPTDQYNLRAAGDCPLPNTSSRVCMHEPFLSSTVTSSLRWRAGVWGLNLRGLRLLLQLEWRGLQPTCSLGISGVDCCLLVPAGFWLHLLPLAIFIPSRCDQHHCRSSSSDHFCLLLTQQGFEGAWSSVCIAVRSAVG